MATKIFVVLDTNILIRYVTQAKPGCDPKSWTTLHHLEKKKAVSFLVPEVVSLEFDKFADDIANKMEVSSQLIKDSLSTLLEDKKIWNEMKDAGKFLQEKLEEWKRRQLKEWQVRVAQVDEWLEGEAVTTMPLDVDLLLRTKRRLISGEYPSSGTPSNDGRLAENDCYIVDSLIKGVRAGY